MAWGDVEGTNAHFNIKVVKMPITKTPILLANFLSREGFQFVSYVIQFQTKATESPQKCWNKFETYNYMGTLHSLNLPRNSQEYGFMELN